MSQQINREDVARQKTKTFKWRIYGGAHTRSFKTGFGNYQMSMLEGDDGKWPYVVRFEAGKIAAGETNDMGESVQAQYDAIVEHHNQMAEEDGPSILEQLDAMFLGESENESEVEVV